MAFVDISPLNVLGATGSPRVLRVTDTFNRAALNPSGKPIWTEYIMFKLPVGTPYLIGGYGGSTAPVGLNMTCLGQNNATSPYPAVLQCIGLDSSVWGKSQYMQATYVQQSAVVMSAGPAVMVDVQGSIASNGACYAVLFIGGPASRLVKMTGGSNLWTENSLVDPIPGDVPTNGDVYRIACQVGASNIITVKKNGVQIATFTDNTPLSTGLPGFTQSSIQQTAGVDGSVIMSNVDCGLGL